MSDITALLNELEELNAHSFDHKPRRERVEKIIDALRASPLSQEPANAERVIAWATDPNRKPANTAFTAGAERQAAYWIEWAEQRVREARS